MRNILLVGLILLSSFLTKAQINAVTETGDEVKLFEDGTWQYLDTELELATAIPVNEKKFTKDKASSFLVKSKKLNVGIWLDPKKWGFTKGTGMDDFEFQFQKKGEDAYAMLIAEKMPIPIETLKGIAISNARSAAPDVKVINEEYRTVNGLQVLMMQMAGTIQGMRFIYYGYYYSNPNGSVQLLTYTGESLLNLYITDMEQFLNGFVELD